MIAYCLCHPKVEWQVKPFQWLWHKYVCCDLELWRTADTPKERWSNDLIDRAKAAGDVFVFMLPDFWPSGPAWRGFIDGCEVYANEHPELLRIDLIGDRCKQDGITPAGTICGEPIYRAPTGAKYNMSLHASVWRKDRMLEILRPGEDPWETEVNGYGRLASRPDLHILGAKFNAIPYAHVCNKFKPGKLDTSGLRGCDVEYMRDKGWLR